MSTRRVHVLALDGGPHCRTSGVDLDVTDDWSAVTCQICAWIVEEVTERWSTPPTPFGWVVERPVWRVRQDGVVVPQATIDAYDRWEDETDVAYARAVVAAVDAGEDVPDRDTFTIERPS